MASTIQIQPLPRRKRFVPKYEVEGVVKLVLGEETQLLIEVVVGSHVNAQYPWKIVTTEKIMAALDLCGELSEFFPLKEVFEAYEDPEMLIGYIPDESKDVDEFYICVTKEAKEHCQQQSEKFIRRQEKKLEKSLQRKARPWTSFGSEVEIKELLPVNTRPLIEVEVKASFPTLYDPKSFVARDVLSVRDGYIELTPYRQKFNNVFKKRVDCASQIGLPKVHRAQQTVLRYPRNMWTQSVADAMGKVENPFEKEEAVSSKKDLTEIKDDEDQEDSLSEDEVQEPIDEVGLATYMAAFKRMRRLSYQKRMNGFMHDIKSELDNLIELNTVMDIYCNDYPNLASKKTVSVYDSMTFEEYVCFTDVRAKDKYVSCAVFHPMWSGIVAISYSDGSPTVMQFVSTRPDPIQRAVYGLNPVLIWSHIDSLIPKLYLDCPREVKSLAFCPFDENLLIGGCINGQVVLWDLTNKLENVENVEVLTETRERYRIAMNSHMWWFKNIQDKSVVQPTAMSNLLTSHYGPITTIKWLSPNFTVSSTGRMEMSSDNPEEPKISYVCFTGSEDGTIQIWNLSIENVSSLMDGKKIKKSKRVLRRPSGLLMDISPYRVLDRNLTPCYRIILGVAGQPKTLSVQSLALNRPILKYTHVPKTTATGRKYFTCEILRQTQQDFFTTIYCGSQHGEMRRIKWEGHAFNTGELVNSEYGDIDYTCFIHDGIVSSTSRNFYLNNITATVGGKVFAIWCDELLGRPLLWKKRSCRLTDVKWSLYKASMLFISTSEGDLETWDLLLRSDQPITTQTVSGTMLTGVSVHALPLQKNIIGVSDAYGSFQMFIDPPIFMIENPTYISRMQTLVERELNVKISFLKWQNEWMKQNPGILLEMNRKEGALLAEKEDERRKKREAEEQRLEEEAEARRLEKTRFIGPVERWQIIIQKLIERTIAVKKRINRAELIEDEKPLRELEAQRLEKERRMLEIMKNQKAIFSDTVAILFPEAIKKPPKPKKTYMSDGRDKLKKEYLDDYEYLKATALKTVRDNPYKASFSWEATIAEGKERKQALNAHETYIKLHKGRCDDEDIFASKIQLYSPEPAPPAIQNIAEEEAVVEEEVEENKE